MPTVLERTTRLEARPWWSARVSSRTLAASGAMTTPKPSPHALRAMVATGSGPNRTSSSLACQPAIWVNAAAARAIPRDGCGPRANAAREQASDQRADGNSDQKARKQQARPELVELEHEPAQERDVNERNHQSHADQQVGQRGADEGAAVQKSLRNQRLEAGCLAPRIEAEDDQAQRADRDEQSARGAGVGVVRIQGEHEEREARSKQRRTDPIERSGCRRIEPALPAAANQESPRAERGEREVQPEDEAPAADAGCGRGERGAVQRPEHAAGLLHRGHRAQCKRPALVAIEVGGEGQ